MTDDSSIPSPLQSLDAGAAGNPRPNNYGGYGISGGVTHGEFYYSVDWLRYTVPYLLPLSECVPDGEVFQPSGVVIRPLQNYNQAVSLVYGSIHWNTERPEQKRLVQFTGTDLAGLLAAGEDISRLLGYVAGLGGLNVTRLDFAVDVRGWGARPEDLKTAFDAGRGITAAQSATFVDGRKRSGESTGSTLYLGSRSSEKFMRVYDKAAQMGVDGDWIRVELELKGDAARAALFAMVWYGIVATGKTLLRSFMRDTGVEWYDAAIDGEGGAYVEPVGRPVTARERWIFEQVIPALDTELRKGNNRVRWSLQKLLDDTEQFAGHGPAVD